MSGIHAREFFKTSPLFDTLEIVKVHDHRCHLCQQLFACSKLGCTIEDRYAVCPRPACVQEWEADDDESDADAEHCNAAEDAADIEAAKIDAARDEADEYDDWDADGLRAGEPSRA